MSDYRLIMDQGVLTGAVKRIAFIEKTRVERYHVIAVSVLHYTARTRNPGLLNTLHQGLNANDQTALRNYIRNFSFLMTQDAKGGYTLVKDNEGAPVPSRYFFLEFSTKTGYSVVRGTVAASDAFMEFAEKELIVPSEKHPPFLKRVNVKDEQVFGMAQLEAQLAALAKKAAASNHINGAGVVVLDSALASIRRINHQLNKVAATPISPEEQKGWDDLGTALGEVPTAEPMKEDNGDKVVDLSPTDYTEAAPVKQLTPPTRRGSKKAKAA